LRVSCPKSVHVNAGPRNKNVSAQKEECLRGNEDLTRRVAIYAFGGKLVFDVNFREYILGAVGLYHHDRIIECMIAKPKGKPSKVTLELTNGINTRMGSRETMRLRV
jgi:hypothetical protein